MAHTTLHAPTSIEEAQTTLYGGRVAPRQADDGKWSSRKTLMFAAGASLALWGLIVLGVTVLF